MLLRSICAFFFISLLGTCTSQRDNNTIDGLQQTVEIIRDSAGVNHIYAQNEHDLFFAQGYCAARDRLFQFELWRRQATGTVAEILGPDEVKRDIGARLFSFRGDMDAELKHYHPRGKEIITAFTDGINAYVRQTLADTCLLPIEFHLLGLRPGLWSPRDVISRHQGILANLQDEVRFARAVVVMGEKKLNELIPFEPGDPNLTLDPLIDKASLFDSVTNIYGAFRAGLKFKPEHLAPAYRQNGSNAKVQNTGNDPGRVDHAMETIGSNNWIVSGSHSVSGYPMLANDPHRTIAVPSLRYLVHLNAPAWNVVGAGEPTIPGVSIGHNEYGAWGLTIFALDAEDVYAYKLRPDDHNQYDYRNSWESMRLVQDTIRVKGEGLRHVTHRYTRHGPVMFIDSARHIAYAARCAWLDIGAAPYLASLRIDQARSWEEFREACSFSRLPGENMIWADTAGHIGWQAVGVAPIRRNYSGLVPVPGNGTYEWDGYLPISKLPNLADPAAGFFATANENNVPEGYVYRNAVGWNWADRFRITRINEVLSSRPVHTLDEMMALQYDYISLPARSLVPLLSAVQVKDSLVDVLRKQLLAWDFRIDKNSSEAAVYVMWERKLVAGFRNLVVPPEGQKLIRTVSLRRVVAWANGQGGPLHTSASRQLLLKSCLEDAVRDLSALLGPDPSQWKYGHEKFHHSHIKHPLSHLVDDSLQAVLNHGPLPRSGYGATPGVTGNANNQATGASVRIVADVSDWDKTMFSNTPGQSGDPRSPYYGNLFETWANDKHFPIYFSRQRVDRSARERTRLKPGRH